MMRFLFCLPLALVVCACHAHAVELIESKTTITLTNRQVAIRFDKRDGALRSFAFNGRELLGNGGRGYVQCVTGNKDDRVRWSYRVVRREAGLVEIAFANINPSFPFELETRYVLRDGDPGFYNYIILGHDAAKHPGAFHMGQLDFCLRADPKIFTTAAVDDERIIPFPKPESLRGAPMLTDATYRLPDGSIYSKYFFSAAMDERHIVHGAAGDGVGLWIAMPSHEHLNGGPEHQELTVHQTDTTPVLLCHYIAGHYGASGIDSSATWTKYSAPWFVFANTGTDLWADAKRRAAQDAAAWPFAWFDGATRRGNVTGKITGGARVILASHEEKPSSLGWQQQWQGCRYAAWANADGRFTIRAVRPGVYDLFAWKPGVIGEFVKRGIRVGVGENVALGELAWTLPRRELLWQIGVPDRSAAEFGYAENFRQWGLWNKIPNEIKFVVGKNNDRDLPFEMAVSQNADNSWRLPRWQLQFDQRGARTGKAVLSLAFAESEENLFHTRRGPTVNVALNGAPLAQITDLAYDGAAHRSGVSGLYQLREIEFDAAKLRDGANTLTLELARPRRGVGTTLGIPAAAVMFDCLRLELAP
jgi:rhamnogalacturonan endolyase